MGVRPLRQYYDGFPATIDANLGSPITPWLRHRRRFADELSALTEEQWRAPSRCEGWDARAIVSHLVTVDSFWVLSFAAAQAHTPPTTFIRGFDPSTGTNDLVAPMLELASETILERFVTGGDALIAVVEQLHDAEWDAPAEAPFGHLPARLILGHALWDSWLHERDILVPLGMSAAVEPDELLVSTWFALLAGGLQWGLLDDDAPVGPGLEAPVDVTIRFDDLPADPMRVRYDSRVTIARAEGADAVAAGSAVDAVEGFTGRQPLRALGSLPPELVGQLARASLFL